MTGSQQTQLGLAGKLVGAGSAACIADAITFPLDVAKVRLQLQGEGAQSGAVKQYRGVLGTVVTIAKQEGPSRLYGGLGPGLQRQACFATVRIGFYDSVKDAYSKAILGRTEGANAAAMMGVRILAAVTTGGLAVVFAQPTDVVKVRMQAQSGTAPRRYKNSFQAYKTIGRVEGFRGLYKGTLPNIARNSIVNAAELVCYDSVKEAILSRNLLQDNIICHFFSAFGAGFCATVVASPVDVVKTRFMNSGAGKYTGATDCAIKMFHEGGFKAFYKGFTPSFVRLGSWNICMFVTYEQLKRLFHYLGNQDIIAGTEPHTLHLSRYSVLAEPSTAILL
ncbi:mitochondrial uncoupling protein 2 [Ixodes scapularis]|uniref:mitochondrial uncoupling protein 2 n=1 Tax=Ixodes scapularis TaxID=6945 RepID=UPI001C393BFA|nr:mitochondrial uncoupling protein 2 [Ixodes scapularis]XP_029840029.3 mitochondrial uncoupling protein 2 [Ixodes scapularis]